MEKLAFTIDIEFLCSHAIDMEWDRLVNSNDDERYYNIYLMSLWQAHIKRKKEVDLEESLETYLKNKGENMDEPITLTTTILNDFARDWFKKCKDTPEYQNAVKLRKFLHDTKSGVYNRETTETIECEYGKHWDAIYSILRDKFGVDFLDDEKNYPICDDWIKNNIVIKGAFYNKEHYTASVNKKATKYYVLLEKSDEKMKEFDEKIKKEGAL